jgi:hypothetical protein
LSSDTKPAVYEYSTPPRSARFWENTQLISDSSLALEAIAPPYTPWLPLNTQLVRVLCAPAPIVSTAPAPVGAADSPMMGGVLWPDAALPTNRQPVACNDTPTNPTIAPAPAPVLAWNVQSTRDNVTSGGSNVLESGWLADTAPAPTLSLPVLPRKVTLVSVQLEAELLICNAPAARPALYRKRSPVMVSGASECTAPARPELLRQVLSCSVHTAPRLRQYKPPTVSARLSTNVQFETVLV